MISFWNKVISPWMSKSCYFEYKFYHIGIKLYQYDIEKSDNTLEFSDIT